MRDWPEIQNDCCDQLPQNIGRLQRVQVLKLQRAKVLMQKYARRGERLFQAKYPKGHVALKVTTSVSLGARGARFIADLLNRREKRLNVTSICV